MERIYSTEHIDWPSVAALFAEVGWGQRDPAQVRAAFEKSSHVMFIYEGAMIWPVSEQQRELHAAAAAQTI